MKGREIFAGRATYTGFEAFLIGETRVRRGRFELSTGKWQCLACWCGECRRNTRYCGLLLTCTTGSGIFSSAAVIEL
jgi:hypothetical protein